jgi:hypothetical protein
LNPEKALERGLGPGALIGGGTGALYLFAKVWKGFLFMYLLVWVCILFYFFLNQFMILVGMGVYARKWGNGKKKLPVPALAAAEASTAEPAVAAASSSLLDLSTGLVDDALLVERLAREFGVCVIPGSACGAPGCIRVCYANLPLDQV